MLHPWGLLSWAVFDNFVETGKFKINDEGELYNVRELDWNRTSALQKAIMIGVPLDTVLWVYYATKYEATIHEPWKRKREIIGKWQLLGNHPYRIDLPTYNFGKDYWSESGNERVQISDFLSHIENPGRFKDVDSVSLRASTEFDGKAYEETLKFTRQSQLQPFHDIASDVETPRIHALSILLGNDPDIRQSVQQNGRQMNDLLSQASHHAKVHLTVMAYIDDLNLKRSEEINMEFYKGRSNDDHNSVKRGLITGDQVINWLKNLHSGKDDTILIYYNGHGLMQGINDEHILLFDFEEQTDKVYRSKLRTLLEQKPGRLKMLITDTCSNRAGTLSPELVAKNVTSLAGVKHRDRNKIIKNLFLQHAGILDITAAQPGDYAWSSEDIGGYFTSGLIQGITNESDSNKDGFLTWQEVFKITQQKTEELFKEAKETGVGFGDGLERMRKQKTQKPFSHSLPKRAK